MNIVALFDAFKEDCPSLAKKATCYTANHEKINSIVIQCDDGKVVTYTKGPNATFIDIGNSKGGD